MRIISIILLLFMAVSVNLFAQKSLGEIKHMVDEGEFSKATKQIHQLLANENLDIQEELALKFELERMDRIRLDFKKTREDVLSYIKKYVKNVDDSMMKSWEESGALEYKIIDGKKWYFNRAHTNLFRLDKKAKIKKMEKTRELKDNLDIFLEGHLPNLVDEYDSTSHKFAPKNYEITYTLTVDADVVPAGEVIRCWIPYPREASPRVKSAELLEVSQDNYIKSPDEYNHSSIYMEKKAVEGEPTKFEVKYNYSAYAEFTQIDPDKVGKYNTDSPEYKTYTEERLPHIVFTDKVKELSKSIVGNETNPYLKAKKIFTWISDNIPWAGAREYSTLRNISDYCLSTGHGDCGIKTLTFITLCRYNGIPAKWQSGWMLHPGEKNLHDWGEFYLEGYGWLPVDQSFGITQSRNEDVAYFYLGGMDAYRLIINDDYSSDFYPAKVYPRSETVDFQRGEVEWKGGNIYFNEWNYHLELKNID